MEGGMRGVEGGMKGVWMRGEEGDEGSGRGDEEVEGG